MKKGLCHIHSCRTVICVSRSKVKQNTMNSIKVNSKYEFSFSFYPFSIKHMGRKVLSIVVLFGVVLSIEDFIEMNVNNI